MSAFGDIVLCDFPFTSATGSKLRPALILFDLGQDALICRITSVPRPSPSEITIQDWRTAGLLKPSFIRIDRLVTAEKSIFVRTLGKLARSDADAVRLAWNREMKL